MITNEEIDRLVERSQLYDLIEECENYFEKPSIYMGYLGDWVKMRDDPSRSGFTCEQDLRTLDRHRKYISKELSGMSKEQERVIHCLNMVERYIIKYIY